MFSEPDAFWMLQSTDATLCKFLHFWRERMNNKDNTGTFFYFYEYLGKIEVLKLMKNVHNAFRFKAGPILSATKPMLHGWTTYMLHNKHENYIYSNHSSVLSRFISTIPILHSICLAYFCSSRPDKWNE
jgi:hypothetical protein